MTHCFCILPGPTLQATNNWYAVPAANVSSQPIVIVLSDALSNERFSMQACGG